MWGRQYTGHSWSQKSRNEWSELSSVTFATSCVYHSATLTSLRWRHHGRDSVSSHQPHDCLLNRLFRRRSKKTPKLRVTGLCAGNSPVTGEFPAQMASNAENVSIWWRHHASYIFIKPYLLKSSKQQFNSHHQISPLKGTCGVQHNTQPNNVTMYDGVHRNTDHAFKTHDLVSEIGNLFDIMTINFSKFNFLSLLPRRKSNDKRCEDLYNWLKSHLWALGDSFNSNYREQSGYRHHKY